jgi:hypothetical protein
MWPSAADRQVTCRIQISLEAVAVSQAAETREKRAREKGKCQKKNRMKKKRGKKRKKAQANEATQALPATETPPTSIWVVLETLIVGSVKISVSKAK